MKLKSGCTDSTNIQSTGAAADALQLRPWEVVGEEWLALRKAGHKTPAIAIWQNLQDPAGNLWREYVNGAYSDPACEHTAKWSRSYPLLTLLAGGEQTMN